MSKTNKNNALVNELIHTHVVMMEGNALAAVRQQLMDRFNNHHAASLIENLNTVADNPHAMVTYKKGTHEMVGIAFFNENLVLTSSGPDGEMVDASEVKEDEERILILKLEGPVTRNGGWCSYGSKDFREMLMEYAEDKSVVGFVLVTDTPGGVCMAMHDFAQGMEAWNAAGKRSIQFIDGDSLSCGVALGCQCQRVIVMNRKDRVGCIGAMMAEWAVADGATNEDGYRYIDVTAEQTPEKNLSYRHAAEGNYDLLQAEVNAAAEDFLAIIDKCRPQITEEQRKGAIYEAGSVIGTLVDGVGTMDDAIAYALYGEENWSKDVLIDQVDENGAEGTEGTEGKCDPEKKCEGEDAEGKCDTDKKGDGEDAEGKCDPDKKGDGEDAEGKCDPDKKGEGEDADGKCDPDKKGEEAIEQENVIGLHNPKIGFIPIDYIEQVNEEGTEVSQEQTTTEPSLSSVLEAIASLRSDFEAERNARKAAEAALAAAEQKAAEEARKAAEEAKKAENAQRELSALQKTSPSQSVPATGAPAPHATPGYRIITDDMTLEEALRVKEENRKYALSRLRR